MPVPKRRHSTARRDKRSAGKRKLAGMGVLTSCQTCEVPAVAHSVCKNCGYYKGNKIITTKADRAKKRIETKDKVVKSQQQRLARKSSSQS